MPRYSNTIFSYSQERGVTLSNDSPADVSVLAVAATGVKAFAGIGPYDFTAGADNADAVGLVVDNLSFGLAIMQDKAKPANKYFSLKGSADEVALYGVPEIAIGVEDIVLELNLSNHIGVDGKRVVVNFTNDALTVDTSPTSSVVMDFPGELIRARLANARFVLSDFIFLSGNFAFEKGSVTTVNVATNFPGDFVNIIDELGDALPGPIKNLGMGLDDLSVIEGVEVTALYLGASNVNGFVPLRVGGGAVGDDDPLGCARVEPQRQVGSDLRRRGWGLAEPEPERGRSHRGRSDDP